MSNPFATPEATSLPPNVPGLFPAKGENASPEDMERRYLLVETWLIEGQSRGQILAAAQELFGVKRRSAQLYLQRVKRRLEKEEENESPTFYRRKAERQRDAVLLLAVNFMRQYQPNEKLLRSMATMVNSVRALLDSRDKSRTLLKKEEAKAKGDKVTWETVRELKAEARKVDQHVKAREEELRQGRVPFPQPVAAEPAPVPEKKPSGRKSAAPPTKEELEEYERRWERAVQRAKEMPGALPLPDGSYLLEDGSRQLPDGTRVIDSCAEN